MDIEFQNGPAFTVAVARLAGGESLRAESGAMISMTTGTQIETSTQGGILKGLKRSLSGESLLHEHVHRAALRRRDPARRRPARRHDLRRSAGVHLALPSRRLRRLRADRRPRHRAGAASRAPSALRRFFVVKCGGQGKAIVATYGALRRVDLQAGQQYTVDSGHLVAWPEGMPIQVHKVGGMKSLFLSGEGFVVTLTGPGTFFMQTRSAAAFVNWLIPLLPKTNN